jgi:hypothetical protein
MAVAVYVLVAIFKKRLALSRSLYQILQILSLNLFGKPGSKQHLRASMLRPNGPRTIIS